MLLKSNIYWFVPLAVFAGTNPRYIIQLKPGAEVLSQFIQNNAEIEILNHQISSMADIKTIVIGDFQAVITELDKEGIERAKKDSNVYNILADFEVRIFDTEEQLNPIISESEPFVKRSLSNFSDLPSKKEKIEEIPKYVKAIDNSPKHDVQADAPNHLSRISFPEGLFMRSKPYEYVYDKMGSGVTAYILDTGIAIDHPDFEGRAVRGGNFVVDELEGDLHGHGTHVAGLVGSKTYGVAKDVSLVEVKVLGKNGLGVFSSILSGIEYVVNDHKNKDGKSVANLSLGSLGNPIIDEAVNEAYKQGVVMVCAAGNSNINVAFTSPARAKGSFTVGALDTKGDTIAIFSNYGEKTDIFAPGVAILSLSHIDYDHPVAMSGTSMASPIIAGLVATELEADDCEAHNVRARVVEKAVKEEISIRGLFSRYKYQGTPNRIAFNGVGKTDPNKKLQVLEPSDQIFQQDQSLLKYVQDINDIDVLDRELWERSEKLHSEKEEAV